MNEDELASLVLAPKGWQVEKGSIPEGYMMHIMSAPWRLPSRFMSFSILFMWFHGILHVYLRQWRALSGSASKPD